MFDQFN